MMWSRCHGPRGHPLDLNSREDPTHCWHLSRKWHTSFTEYYLAGRISQFEHVSTTIGFSRRSLRSVIPRLIIKLKGEDWWEKHHAFVYQAQDITTVLRVRKPDRVGHPERSDPKYTLLSDRQCPCVSRCLPTGTVSYLTYSAAGAGVGSGSALLPQTRKYAKLMPGKDAKDRLS